jgi:hypothetical protein
VEATYVGHDLTRGTSVFAKATRAERTEDEETDSTVKELIHDTDVDLPQLDSWGQQREPGDGPATSRVA